MKKETVNKAAGILAIISSAVGIWYMTKKTRQPQPQLNPATPQGSGNTMPLATDLIGRTVSAVGNGTVIYKANQGNGYWETTDIIRLTRQKDEQIGVVIEIVQDGFTDDTYAIVDIPFYVGSMFNTGHGFINTKYIKSI